MAVVLVTGATSGFGLRTALRFAGAGHHVVAGARHPDAARDLRAAASGLPVEVVGLDVTDEASVGAAVAGALAAHGALDVVVNNAGVGVRGAVEEVPDDLVRAAYEVNVFGVLRVVRAVLPSMRARGAGVIVNVSSLAALVPNPFSGVYSSTKAALEALSEALHYELQPFGVRVVVIEPGTFPTGFDERRLEGGPDPGSPYAARRRRWDEAYRRLPGRDVPADPEEVAEAVVRAATDPAHPRRRLVGADAELVAGLRRQLDDAEFERTVRTALDFWD